MAKTVSFCPQLHVFHSVLSQLAWRTFTPLCIKKLLYDWWKFCRSSAQCVRGYERCMWKKKTNNYVNTHRLFSFTPQVCVPKEHISWTFSTVTSLRAYLPSGHIRRRSCPRCHASLGLCLHLGQSLLMKHQQLSTLTAHEHHPWSKA